MSSKDKNINNPELTKITNFSDALNRLMGSADGSTKNGYVIIKELITFIRSTLEQKIHIPSTQPALLGSDLTLDMESNRQAIFEGRKSIADLTIDSDFNFIVSNKSNALVLSCVLSLTGELELTFEADVLISNPSSIGVWASPVLTLSAGTDDLIEFNLLRYNTSSKWLLVVGEVAV